MPPDDASPARAPFGRHRLSPPLAALLRLCHAMPRSWLGKRVAFALRRILIAAIGRKTFDANVKGVRMRFRLGTNRSERNFVFTPQLYDWAEFTLIDRALPPDGVFVDIGANVGVYSLWAARRLGPEGRVLAIEPNPAALSRLHENIGFNDFAARITVIPVGVADKDGSFTLHLDPANLGASSLKGRSAQTIEIACRPLAALLAERGIAAVDILKIDIEGAEDIALAPFFETASPTLYPGHVIIERSMPQWGADLLGLMAARGYTTVAETRRNLILRRD
jgi:FkbM family methyltransferase